MSNDEKTYRVRILIYEDDPEQPIAQTDEPLYSGLGGADEMSVQAYRTHGMFTSLTPNQNV